MNWISAAYVSWFLEKHRDEAGTEDHLSKIEESAEIQPLASIRVTLLGQSKILIVQYSISKRGQPNNSSSSQTGHEGDGHALSLVLRIKAILLQDKHLPFNLSSLTDSFTYVTQAASTLLV